MLRSDVAFSVNCERRLSMSTTQIHTCKMTWVHYLTQSSWWYQLRYKKYSAIMTRHGSELIASVWKLFYLIVYAVVMLTEASAFWPYFKPPPSQINYKCIIVLCIVVHVKREYKNCNILHERKGSSARAAIRSGTMRQFADIKNIIYCIICWLHL